MKKILALALLIAAAPTLASAAPYQPAPRFAPRSVEYRHFDRCHGRHGHWVFRGGSRVWERYR
jgi:hypothetical protein